MKRLATFIHGVKNFGLFVGFYLEKRFEHILGKDTPLTVLVLLAFLALIASAKGFELLAAMAVERWTWLRKKISGDNYIEGVWFNKVPGAVSLYGLLRIEFSDGAVKLEGEQYDKSATLTATWHSTMAEFTGSTLTYAYKVIYAKEAQNREVQGVSRVSFGKVSSSGIPMCYTGHFQDIAVAGEQCTFCFTGFRVDDKKVLQEFEAAKGKHDAVVKLIWQLDDANEAIAPSE